MHKKQVKITEGTIYPSQNASDSLVDSTVGRLYPIWRYGVPSPFSQLWIVDRTYGSVPDVSDQLVPPTWTDGSLTFGRLRRRLRRNHTEYCLQYAGMSFILELLILHSRDNWLRLITC